MISRRLLISSAAAVGAAGFSGSLFAAAPEPVLGKDYIEVRPPLEFPQKTDRRSRLLRLHLPALSDLCAGHGKVHRVR